MGEALLEIVRYLVLVPAIWLWQRGWWGRLGALAYVVLPPVVAGYVAVTELPALLPWGWPLYGILLIWAVNLLEVAIELVKDGVRYAWRRLRSRSASDGDDSSTPPALPLR